ncbi:MAG: restriction endonuclease subunit S [Candidatus Thiodiazotropha sp. (ex Codakia orbicularis)]|nr:restriction endonuclease subunit S [Candidatus Thiodiazotropha sp. (ex Codakia orbicularis)]
MKGKKKEVVPRLRFPEFRDGGVWVEKLLKDVAPLQRGFDLPTHKLEFGGIPVVYSNGVQNYHNRGMAEGPGLITGRSGTIGKLHFIEAGDYWPHNTTLWVTSFNDNVPKFIYFLYSAIGLERFVSGSGVPTLNRNYVHACSARIPRLKEEQQKIADCLSSLDTLIAAQADKLDALKAHKKGLMQQLFPREGETVPRLRFPEFRDGGDWVEKPLGSLSVIVRGGSPRPIDAYLTKDINGLNWLKIGDVDKEAKYINNTAERVKQSALKKTRVVKPGDLIMSNSMSFGRPYVLEITSCIHDGWIAVTEISNEILSDYLYYVILSGESQMYFLNAAAGGGVKNLNADIIKLLPVLVSLKQEQQKIADCLSSLDTLIAAQADKLDALKAHKKGLMQQLFPSPEVVGA